MASLWKDPRTKYLIACFTDRAGRRVKRSTKTTDRKLALKMANQFETESNAKRTAKQARRVLTDIYRELCGEEAATVTVREHFSAFIARKKLEVSPATMDYYSGHSKRFLEWLGAKAEGDLSEITKADVTAYRNAVAGHAGPRTTNNTLKAIRAFFAAARKDGYISDDPAVDVDTVRDRGESNRRPFTMDELRAVLGVAGGEWKSMIIFGLYTGQRLGDIASLTWSNLDLEANEIRLVTRKTGRRQALPLPAALRTHVASLPAGDDPSAPLHPKAAAIVGKSGRSNPLSKEFAKLLEGAGLRTGNGREEGYARSKNALSFHSLRHTATSLLKAAGVPQSVVMAYIGHDSADVSHGYTHTGKEALLKAAEALPTLTSNG
jgi:integrase